MKKIYSLLSFLLLFSHLLFAQVYIEKQTRHRFAQLNFGVDLQSSMGGSTSFLNSQGNLQDVSFSSTLKPRILIGGTHFWGHADIYLAIPVAAPSFQAEGQEVTYTSGVETVFKYYPWRIQHNRLTLFIGTSIAPFYFEQDNTTATFGDGPELNHTSLPLYTGFTFNTKQHLLELGLMYNYAHKQDYYIDRSTLIEVETPPLFLNLSYRFFLDTTLGAEKGWENKVGSRKEIERKVKEKVG